MIDIFSSVGTTFIFIYIENFIIHVKQEDVLTLLRTV